MTRSSTGLALAIVGAGALIGSGAWLGLGAHAASAPSDPLASASGTTTALISRRDLVNRERLDGSLGFLESGQRIVNQAPGTITALDQPGTVVSPGQALYEVDGEPVILFYGTRPAWRTLAIGAQGADVKQLEENLIALGFANSSNLRVDGSFGASDAAAVKRWQKSLGLPQTGQVDFGRVVFLPDALRIGLVKAALGDLAGPGQDVMEGSSTTRIVTVDLDASKQTLIKVGDPVEITVHGQTTAGTVSSIAKVATPSTAGPAGKYQGIPAATVTVIIAVADQALAGDVDQEPVQVGVITQSVQQVLAVPISALLASADGGYAVEVLAGGHRRLVPVTTGLFDDEDSLVEVRGAELRAGMQVVVPQ